jgi:hypothetical protein
MACRVEVSATALSFEWLEDAPEGDHFVGSHGRLFDVIVLGRPARDLKGSRMTTLEAALFESGRPVLIAPPSPRAQIGTYPLIAWNCSTEQARTIALAALCQPPVVACPSFQIDGIT